MHSESSESNKIETEPRGHTHYTYQEEVDILQYIVQNKLCSEINEPHVWRDISEKGIVERSGGAIRYHFRTKIVTSLHRFRLSEKVKEQLLVYSGYYYDPPGSDKNQPQGLRKIPKEFLAPKPFHWMEFHRPRTVERPPKSSTQNISEKKRHTPGQKHSSFTRPSVQRAEASFGSKPGSPTTKYSLQRPARSSGSKITGSLSTRSSAQDPRRTVTSFIRKTESTRATSGNLLVDMRTSTPISCKQTELEFKELFGEVD